MSDSPDLLPVLWVCADCGLQVRSPEACGLNHPALRLCLACLTAVLWTPETKMVEVRERRRSLRDRRLLGRSSRGGRYIGVSL